MSSVTDYLHLNEHKIFQEVRKTLPKDLQTTKSVMCVREDILYTWNFQDNCVLCLNVKAARSREGDNIIHQSLMPMSAPYFTPEYIRVNETNTLLVAYGKQGVLVFVLPSRSPPYGLFSNGKEMIYCRSYSLHERALAFSTTIEVRQARFHPGSKNDSHLVILTSDNILRVYNIEDTKATCGGVFSIGIQPVARHPGSKESLMESLGETAVDFDFGPPEKKSTKLLDGDETLVSYNSTIQKTVVTESYYKIPNKDDSKLKTPETEWPIFIIYGNALFYSISITLGDKLHPGLKGPHHIQSIVKDYNFYGICSMTVIQSTPPVLALANRRGTLHHVIVLPAQKDYKAVDTTKLDPNRMDGPLPRMLKPDKTLCLMETIELELGLGMTPETIDYFCAIRLHRDASKVGNYFATHEAGVHSVSMPSIEMLHAFLNSEEDDDDEFLQGAVQECSTPEYLVCTRTVTSEKCNPVIGFSTYDDPQSIIILLANGQLVTMAMVTVPLPMQEFQKPEELENMNSPLKSMLSNPFDAQIQKILKQSTSQPILKLSKENENTQQDCYELLQRAAQTFRDEHFKHHDQAREEIEKRVKALRMLKDFQVSEINRMMEEKQELQDTAENLAEKYEDLKDKQESLIERCKVILMMISEKQTTPSYAELNFLKKLKDYEKGLERYVNAVDKLRNKMKYQDVQMSNWKQQNQKASGLGSTQSEAIKGNLQDMTDNIATLMKEVNEYKLRLNIE